MARPQKRGLDYFPLDVDIDQDDKIQLVEAVHNATGFSVVIKLLMRIYKEGYYYEWGEMEQLLFSRRVNVDINTIKDIVNDCIKFGLFNQKIYETYKVLTSSGIQERYFEATKRRKNVVVVNQYMLISDVKKVNDNIIEVNVNINGDIVDSVSTKTPQRKVKESKEEESKGKETTGDEKNLEQKPVVVVDKDFGKLADFYSKNIGPLNYAIDEVLNEMTDLLNAELALLALRKAVVANAENKVNYTFGILRNWKSQNFKTTEDVEQHEARQQNQRQNRKFGSQREEMVPEWFKTRNEQPAPFEEPTDPEEIERKRQELLIELGVVKERAQ